ncbi:unnamed protein product [Caenorhabditis brenneri]
MSSLDFAISVLEDVENDLETVRLKIEELENQERSPRPTVIEDIENELLETLKLYREKLEEKKQTLVELIHHLRTGHPRS